MKGYQWILFDADETLFHFDAFQGLQRMFSGLDVEFTEADYVNYQEKNKSLWVAYQNNAITVQQLKEQRFSVWSNKLQVSALELNTGFMSAMAEICAPKEGAVNLLNALLGKAKLGLVTNGFTELQERRLQRTGLQDHFDLVVVSEEVGVAKPHPGIFEYALARMGELPRSQVLMVGDTLESDILGGINAGFDTCWLNVEKKTLLSDIQPHYEVTSLLALEHLLLGAAEAS